MLTGKIRDDLEVSVEEFERLLRQEGQWVRHETTQLMTLISLALFLVSAIFLTTLACWKFDLNFFLAAIIAIPVAFFASSAIGSTVTAFLSYRYRKQTEARVESQNLLVRLSLAK